MRKIVGIASLLAAVLVYAFAPSDVAKRTIVIDAGHGGKDPGAQVEGVLEKEVVRSMALKIKELNNSAAFEVVLLREADVFMSLADRVAQLNALEPDLVVSLHVNQSDNPDKHGVELFVCPESTFYEESRKQAVALQAVLKKGLVEVGVVKEANLHILKNSEAPALLVELGYLSNSSDSNYLTSVQGQEQMARLLLAHFEK